MSTEPVPPPTHPRRTRTPQARILRPLLTWLRGGAIGFAWVLVVLGQQPVAPELLLVATVGLTAWFAWQAIAPTRLDGPAALAGEPTLAIVAVLLTGGWGSPFVLYLAVPLLHAAVMLGPSVLVLAAAHLAVLAAQEALDATPASPGEVTQTLVPMAVALGVGLVSRRIVVHADDEQSRTLGHVQQLLHVNALLSTLHEVVRSTPAPLTVEDVLRLTQKEIEQVLDVDAVLLLLADEGGRWWRPVAAEGATVGHSIARSQLPAEVLAGQSPRPVEVPRLAEGEGVTPRARSGAYLWLFSRGQPAALLVLEHRGARQLPEARLEMLERMSAPLGLAIDNAIWFQRLRTLGAEEERQRIGAQLHDQFAQSLAYVNMELGRTAARHPGDAEVARLQEQVHTLLADLRETLRELRLRCTEDRGLAETLADHVDRFGDRFGVVTEFEASGTARPPLSIENQLLRVAQDLLILAQREAGATMIAVTLASEPSRIRLVVHDDGRGTAEEDLGHGASQLLSLVRDRADAVGGLVDVVTHDGEGTEVAVTVRGLM